MTRINQLLTRRPVAIHQPGVSWSTVAGKDLITRVQEEPEFNEDLPEQVRYIETGTTTTTTTTTTTAEPITATTASAASRTSSAATTTTTTYTTATASATSTSSISTTSCATCADHYWLR